MGLHICTPAPRRNALCRPAEASCRACAGNRWLGGAYWMLVTMLSIGYGDITPVTNTEIIVVMFCMISGIVFFGVLLGSIAEAITVGNLIRSYRLGLPGQPRHTEARCIMLLVHGTPPRGIPMHLLSHAVRAPAGMHASALLPLAVACCSMRGGGGSPVPQDLSKDHKQIARFRSRMEAVDKWMSKRSLPKKLRERIAHYYQDVRTPRMQPAPCTEQPSRGFAHGLQNQAADEHLYLKLLACRHPAQVEGFHCGHALTLSFLQSGAVQGNCGQAGGRCCMCCSFVALTGPDRLWVGLGCRV